MHSTMMLQHLVPDSPTTTPLATTSFQSPPLVLSAPPASTERYGLHDPYDSFFPDVATLQFTFPSLPSPSLPSHSLPRHSPVLPAPVLPAPVLPTPVLPAPVLPAPTLLTPVLPAPVLPAPTLLTPVLPAPILPSSVLPAPVLPSVPLAPPAAETPQNGDVQHSAPEKTLKVKQKHMSKVVDTVMEVVESANPNTLRKTGRIWQESTRMAQANQIGQINK
ncbi:hypothetical protein BDR07DRAFT_1384801 [Suillus spraguei]|nr:hypothetical protein BDR07DRAFT_1384801 [Suillus spraguei]